MVSKTKTYENEDRRPKMGLRNYENEDPLRKRRPIFVFVITKTKTHYENEDPSLFSYYENEDPKIFIYIVFAKIKRKSVAKLITRQIIYFINIKMNYYIKYSAL